MSLVTGIKPIGVNSRDFTNIIDWGADPSGVVDSTAAINAAYASMLGKAGCVVWPAGGYTCSGTITIGDNTSTTPSFISTWAPAGPNNTVLRYTGGAGTTALAICFNKYFFFKGLNVSNQGGAAGCIGIALANNLPASGNNQVLASIFEQITVGGFAGTNGIGLQAGGNNAASEIIFTSCNFYNNTTAYIQNSFNSLDNSFVDCSFSNNTTGIDTGSNSNLNVWGGSSSAQVVDFHIQNNAQSIVIDGFRSEVCTGACVRGTGSGSVRISTCEFLGIPGGANAVDGRFAAITILDSAFIGTAPGSGGGSGGVVFTANPLSLVMINNRLSAWNTVKQLPYSVSTVDSATSAYVSLKNNVDAGFPPLQLFDFEGVSNSSYGVSPSILKIPPVNNNAVSNGTPSYATDYLALCHVRHLSEGSVSGGWADAQNTPDTVPFAPGQNLRIQRTFASSNTLNVLFVRNVSVSTASANPNWNAATPSFFLSDVGKPASVAGHGNQLQTDWHGTVASFVSPTHIVVTPQPPQVAPNLPSPVTAVIGANEPDANYMVLVQGVSGETYGVSAISATGFTVTSSSATSTATVTCLIIR